MEVSERITGCLLGGAVGDALGAPVEFMSLCEIRSQFGSDGIDHYVPVFGKVGAITDDTQMTLFTLEGLLRTDMRHYHKGIASYIDCVRFAYMRWLGTQGTMVKNDRFSFIYNGWLWKQNLLHSRRAPGNSCLSALGYYASQLEQNHLSISDQPINNSKGCGGIMRMAPVGFFNFDCFNVGCELAKLTHGHPSGYIASGFFAQLIAEIIEGCCLEDAIELAKDKAMHWADSHEVMRAVNMAIDFATHKEATPETIKKLGEGWVAEEALAISLFCALKAKSFEHGVLLAVNHDGDSDSTGAITGNILGALWGQKKIPEHFLLDLELRDVIEQMAWDVVNFSYTDEWWDRYPGT